MKKERALQLLEEYTKDFSVSYKYSIEGILKKFPDDFDFNTITEQDFLTVFSLTDSTDYNSVNSLKAKFKSFLQRLYNDGYIKTQNYEAISNVSYSKIDRSRQIKTYYVKNWNDLYKNLLFYFEEGDDRLLTIQVTLILSFYGMTLQEIGDCLKEQVNTNEKTIDLQDGRKIILPSSAFKIISDYKDLRQFYCPTPKERYFDLPDGKYLIRNAKVNHFENDQFKNLKDMANAKLRSRKVDKRVKWNAIYQSGQMNRLYEYEIKNGEISTNETELIESFLGTKKYGKAFDFYGEWKQYFYSNE